jgi:uncharacterized membrane protein
MRTQRGVFVILVLAAALQIAYFYPLLPDTMASHFDGSGRPNGWASKGAFIALYIGLLAMMAANFLVLPAFLEKLPVSLVNLPNKSYWLAPERREQAWAKVQVYLLAFGNAAVALMFFVFQLAMLANLSESRMLSPAIWVLLAAFVAFVGGCLFRLFRAFRLPPGA